MARAPVVAHSGLSSELGRNNDSDVEASTLSSKSRVGERLDEKSNNATTVSEKQDHHEKPIMPRAKRVISFDDQTSRLSRSKLVIV
jgi:hypothetical protein